MAIDIEDNRPILDGIKTILVQSLCMSTPKSGVVRSCDSSTWRTGNRPPPVECEGYNHHPSSMIIEWQPPTFNFFRLLLRRSSLSSSTTYHSIGNTIQVCFDDTCLFPCRLTAHHHRHTSLLLFYRRVGFYQTRTTVNQPFISHPIRCFR